MYSLRQIFVAGLGGVFPGCLLLSCNFVYLPYRRGAVIGILFGSLTQVVLMLLYLMIFSGISTALDDVLLKLPLTQIAIILSISVLQLMTAMGCTAMGKYFLCPTSDVTTFDRSVLEARIVSIDTGKRSVVNDIVKEFKETPAVPARRRSWFHVFGAIVVTLFVLFLWIRAVILAFYPLWFDKRTMDALWAWDLFVSLFWPWLLLTGFGYAILGVFAFTRSASAKNH
jgi:hypothetical protein